MSSRIDTQALKQAVDICRDGVAILDARHEDKPVIYANDALHALLETGEGMLVERPWPFFSVTPDCEPELASLGKAIERSDDASVPLRLMLANGQTAVIECIVKTAADGRGKPTHHIVLMDGVGERAGAVRSPVAAEVPPAAAFTHRIDPLTGLKTWQHFRDLFGRDWGMSQREGRHISVLLFDIDCFDHYNRRLGEQAGDLCLKRIARVIEDSLRRAGDLVARYGGEEFIVTATGLDQSRARAFGELLCARASELKIEHPECPVAPYITLSAGVASVQPSHDMLPEHLITAADDALSDAKAGGRNRVVSARVTRG